MRSGRPSRQAAVLVGGSGRLGAALADRLGSMGVQVLIVDKQQPSPCSKGRDVAWIKRDLLVEDASLPAGAVFLLVGAGDPCPRWAWTLPLDAAMVTARLLPHLAGRSVTLISSLDVYGDAAQPFTETTPPALPISTGDLEAWCAEARSVAAGPCPPWQVAPLCRALVEADAAGRWAFGITKAAQEVLLRSVVGPDLLTILRVGNIFGTRREDLVSSLAREALRDGSMRPPLGSPASFVHMDDVARTATAGLGPGTFNVAGPAVTPLSLARRIRDLAGSRSPIDLRDGQGADGHLCGAADGSKLASAGLTLGSLDEGLARLMRELADPVNEPLFEPPLRVVIPPRPARPDVVADRQQACLWLGAVKAGNRWSMELEERLKELIGLGEGRRLHLTTSGTQALRLAVAGVVGRAAPGEVVALPSFTYPATGEVLAQLGYGLRFVDVEESTWTMSAQALRRALEETRVKAIVCVDTFGNPCDYDALLEVSNDVGVPLIADSAAGLGSRAQGRALGVQAEAHAFSMSFAKVVSAGGAGGAVVMPADADLSGREGWVRSALMDELHAIAALDQLDLIEDLVRRREEVAGIYEEAAGRLGGLSSQQVRPEDRHSWVHWVMRVRRAPGRLSLQTGLQGLGVETRAYFSAVHLNGWQEDSPHLPVTEALDAEVLALPMSSEMTSGEARMVVAAVEEVLARSLSEASGQSPGSASPRRPARDRKQKLAPAS